MRINNHKKNRPVLEQGGSFRDQTQVFPCFHCGGSRLLTKGTYLNRTSNKPLAGGFEDWHSKRRE